MIEVAGIVKSLTKAEREWLGRPMDRMHSGISTFLVADGLERKGLAKPVYCPLEKAFGHTATSLGLAVRSALAKENDRGE